MQQSKQEATNGGILVEQHGRSAVYPSTLIRVCLGRTAHVCKVLCACVMCIYSGIDFDLGWSGGAKASCILRHRGVQLILAYSWARPAILVAGKGRWGIFLFLLFLHFHSCSFLPCPSL